MWDIFENVKARRIKREINKRKKETIRGKDIEYILFFITLVFLLI